MEIGFKPLEAITPIDGRYRDRIGELSRYFSEYALIKERLKIEAEFLKKFVGKCGRELAAKLPRDWEERVEKLVEEFGAKEAEEVKGIEKVVGHDVKALINYLMKRLQEMGLKELSPYVHLGLTSDDINNLAYSSLLLRFRDDILIPRLTELVEATARMARENLKTVMLGRTHGVPAVPTTFGRFLANYAYRVSEITLDLFEYRFPGKLGGAVGDNSALKFTYPEVDWMNFGKEFVESLGLEYLPASTQILPHDRISTFFSKLSILSSILSNLCRDLWILSALGLLFFGRRSGEAHSSTMPHKSNPLHLENAEGAFDLASSLLSYMAVRLISSRLHRDLSDSIIKRFYGLPLSLVIVGIGSLNEGLRRMVVRSERMREEVKRHPEVLAEAYQVYLRAHGFRDAYEAVQKALGKGWDEVVREVGKRAPEISERLERLKPEEYIGEAVEIAEKLLKDVEDRLNKIRGARV